VNASIDSNKKPGLLAWIVGVTSALAIAVFSYQLPENQWDMLGHLGGALHFGIDDPEELHRQTYALAQKTLTPEDYLELTDGNVERKAWSRDPGAFLQVLPFYEPRVLVTGPAYIAHKAGFNPILYMRLQSSIAAGLGVLLFTLVLALCSRSWLVLVVPLLASISGVLDVARFEGADALSFVAYAGAVYLLMKRSWWSLAVIALLPLTRSDMIIYALPALLYFAWVFKEKLHLVTLAIVVCLASYFAVNSAFDNYGWVKQFYVAQIQYLSHPADVSVRLTAEMYIGAVIRGTVKLLYNYQFQFFALISLVILSACWMRLKETGARAITDEYVLGLCVLAMFFVVTHFLVFPSMHTRYFVGQYLHVAVITLAVIAGWARHYLGVRPR
jgi:hypothetical protein